MELNIEQNIKALECCASYDRDTSCGECPYMYAELADNEICSNRMATDALTLIKELTEEVEARKVQHEKFVADIEKQLVELTEEVEARKLQYESLYETAKQAARADLVRVMRERIKEYVSELLKGRVEMISQYIRIINEGVDHIADQIEEGT